jgi:hypothetical protein
VGDGCFISFKCSSAAPFLTQGSINHYLHPSPVRFTFIEDLKSYFNSCKHQFTGMTFILVRLDDSAFTDVICWVKRVTNLSNRGSSRCLSDGAAYNIVHLI